MIMKKLILFIWLFTPLFVILADADLADDSDRPVARAQKLGNTIIYTDEKGNLIGKEEHRDDTIIYTDNTGTPNKLYWRIGLVFKYFEETISPYPRAKTG